MRAIGRLQTLETSGTVREARDGLEDVERSFLIAYCMFMRPTTRIAGDSARDVLDLRQVSLRDAHRRVTQAESPEWTPAYSMCSITAGRRRPLRPDRIGLALGGVGQEAVDQDRAIRVTATALAT